VAAYIIGMPKIVSLASQRKRVAAPRAEPDGASVGYLTDKSAIRWKDPWQQGSLEFFQHDGLFGS
jgi:hypothetical protein